MIKKWEGSFILLYILTSERYKKHIKSEKFKYLPDFFLPIYKPQIIDTITKDGISLGDVVGINIKPIDFHNTTQQEKYIENIKKLNTKNYTNIYLEEYYKLPAEIMDKIIDSTELNLISGDNTRILNIPNIIKEIHKYLKQDYYSKDTLIICSDINRLKFTIEVLSEHIKFITVIGLDYSWKEEIYEEVLESTGISIFQPNNLEKIIKNYSIIINFNDIIDFNINSIRNESVILDFSREKPFKLLNKSKKSIVIDEINFDINLDSYKWIGSRVCPDLLESLGQHNEKEFRQIGIKNDFYFVKDFIFNGIKLRGKV